MRAGAPVGKVVLIIVGNTSERLELTGVLQQEGYRVAAAEDGAGALALVRAGCRPDLVLVALSGDAQDGWDFLDQRRHEPALAAVPVLLGTEREAAGPEWVRSLSACARLRKPFDVAALLDEVRRYAE